VKLHARFVPGHLWDAPPSLFGPVNRADVMVIGKCLGREEIARGRNFIGDASQLLATAMVNAGATYAEICGWYMTNLVKHADIWGSGKTPAGIVKNCAILLEQELRLVRPKFVLCLGNEASAWMLGTEQGSVSDSLGRVFSKKIRVDLPGEGERWHEFKFMTCVHPSALVHAPMRRNELDETLTKFWRMVKGLDIDPAARRDTDYRTIYCIDELREEVDKIIAEHKTSGRRAQKLALDCEWHGYYWTSSKRPLKKLTGDFVVRPEKGETESWLRTVQFSHRPGYGRCVVLRDGGPRAYDGNDRVGLPTFAPSISAAMAEIRRLFTPTEDRQIRLVGHNLRADIPWVSTEDPVLAETLMELFDPAPDINDCRDLGGFDTMYACHAVNENAEKKLEVVGMSLCGIPRYDGEIAKQRVAICKRAKIKQKDIPGYGEITDEGLHPYGCQDVDVSLCIEDILTKPGGKLDKDEFGLSSWRSWYAAQGKMLAELEMEMAGLLIDARRAERLTAAYKVASDRLKAKVSEITGWPDFNVASPYQVRTVLFGPFFAGKICGKTGVRLDPRPAEAMGCTLLNLTPIKATGKPAVDWSRVVADGKEHKSVPTTDKETLGILLSRLKQENNHEAAAIVDTMRSCRFVNKVLSTVLCPPDAGGKEIEYDDDGDMVHEKGFLSSVESDNRVRTHFLPVDTHRVSSSDPNIQNLSKRREDDMRKILGDLWEFPLRSIVTSPPGYVLIEADLSGAELLMMAVQSGSAKMVEHCLRSAYPENDERHYDIHSRIAKACFKFDGPPLKSWLKKNGKSNLRDIAKTVVFGLPYGRGDTAILRGIEETGVVVTMDDVAKVRETLFGEYPELEPFFALSQARVETHGYLRTCFLSTRRFSDWGGRKDVLERMKRQAGNFPIQGGIAGALKHILRAFHKQPGRILPNGKKRFRMVAEIHDAVMSEVAIPDVAWYVDEVLPACMSNAALIYPCDFDGIPLPGRDGVKLGYEYNIYKNWGEDLTYASAAELGLPERFWPAKK
jgi:DNA polymerase